MRSTKPRARISALILSLTALAVAGCVSTRPVVSFPSACSALVPKGNRLPVESAPFPAEDATAGDVWKFGLAQTGQLDKSNGRNADNLEVITGCEARDAATVKKLTRPFWKFWG